MYASMPNMNIYDYNQTKNQMLNTKSKTRQQIKIEQLKTGLRYRQTIKKLISSLTKCMCVRYSTQ